MTAPPAAEPVAWVIPGEDTADRNGWIDARCDKQGEFTKPLYTTPPSGVAEGLLRAWCQKCHLTYDAAHHARNARQTRRNRKAIADIFEAKS